jgi:hypothetical protein
MSIITLINRTGDQTIATWDVLTEAESVVAAKEVFDKHRKQGCAAFDVSGGQGSGKLIHEFDPNAEKIVMMLPIVGG